MAEVDSHVDKRKKEEANDLVQKSALGNSVHFTPNSTWRNSKPISATISSSMAVFLDRDILLGGEDPTLKEQPQSHRLDPNLLCPRNTTERPLSDVLNLLAFTLKKINVYLHHDKFIQGVMRSYDNCVLTRKHMPASASPKKFLPARPRAVVAGGHLPAFFFTINLALVATINLVRVDMTMLHPATETMLVTRTSSPGSVAQLALRLPGRSSAAEMTETVVPQAHFLLGQLKQEVAETTTATTTTVRLWKILLVRILSSNRLHLQEINSTDIEATARLCTISKPLVTAKPLEWVLPRVWLHRLDSRLSSRTPAVRLARLFHSCPERLFVDYTGEDSPRSVVYCSRSPVAIASSVKRITKAAGKHNVLTVRPELARARYAIPGDLNIGSFCSVLDPLTWEHVHDAGPFRDAVNRVGQFAVCLTTLTWERVRNAGSYRDAVNRVGQFAVCLTTLTREHVRSDGSFRDAVNRVDQFAQEHLTPKNLEFAFDAIDGCTLRHVDHPWMEYGDTGEIDLQKDDTPAGRKDADVGGVFSPHKIMSMRITSRMDLYLCPSATVERQWHTSHQPERKQLHRELQPGV
ncbi:uncharacterized protein BDZ99DRAFT_525828 [Mytilinidion resinicola]|uniref:Uncharacterized protein n=1 Tax=Mytilinidion resinicola TaxID=574789 RepID=A0A6A6Y5Z6_9PEZI|nr:uncharacterized protein BDZ99DRAFT_525828 [Mytilinidion resinicola]KAF2804236.1 hypothetical protein BDZ99DRAFT_525828 [Mytilinidion resinicola]